MDPLLQNLVDASTSDSIIQSLKKFSEIKEPDDIKYRNEQLRDIFNQKRSTIAKLLSSSSSSNNVDNEENQNINNNNSNDKLAGAIGEFLLWFMPHQEERKEEGMRGQELCMTQDFADFIAITVLPHTTTPDSIYFVARSICRLTYDASSGRKFFTSRNILVILVSMFPKAMQAEKSCEFLVSAINNITLDNPEASKLLMTQRCADGFATAFESIVPENDNVAEWVARSLYNIVSLREDKDDDEKQRSAASKSSGVGYYEQQKRLWFCTPRMLRALVNALRVGTRSASSVEYISDCITEIMAPDSSASNEEMKEIVENEECVALLFSQLDHIAEIHDQCLYGVMNALGAISRSSVLVATVIGKEEKYLKRITATIQEATTPYIIHVFCTVICNVTHHYHECAEYFATKESVDALIKAMEFSLDDSEASASVGLVLNNLTSLSPVAVENIVANPRNVEILFKALEAFTETDDDYGVERIACVLTNATRRNAEFITKQIASSHNALRIISSAFIVPLEAKRAFEIEFDLPAFASEDPFVRAEYWLDVVANNIAQEHPDTLSTLAAFDPRASRMEVEILRATTMRELLQLDTQLIDNDLLHHVAVLPKYRLWISLVRKFTEFIGSEKEFDDLAEFSDQETSDELLEDCRQIFSRLLVSMPPSVVLCQESLSFFFFAVLHRACKISAISSCAALWVRDWGQYMLEHETFVARASTPPLVSPAEISLLFSIIRTQLRCDAPSSIGLSFQLISFILGLFQHLTPDRYKSNKKDSPTAVYEPMFEQNQILNDEKNELFQEGMNHFNRRVVKEMVKFAKNNATWKIRIDESLMNLSDSDDDDDLTSTSSSDDF